MEPVTGLLSNDFLPHGYCIAWQPGLLWLHIVSDGLIGLSYYSIPIALGYFVGARKDLAYKWMFTLFSAFIFACGTTHIMSIITLWEPVYWTDGAIKGMTAVVSALTAVLLWRLIPKALLLPSPAQLEQANRQLRQESLEHAQAVETLARRTQELTRSNAELAQFAYVASHDLQEPLRMVTSYVQLLARRYQGQLDEEADEFIDFAVEGVNRMQQLIGDLLAYSRVHTRAKSFEPVDCDHIVRRVQVKLQTEIKKSKGTIRCDPLPKVMGDQAQLVQLFQHLIDNALKFRRKDPPEIHLSATRQDGEWLFACRDNGIGIEPQYFERIFVIFQRLHTRAEYPGTGIGLALCKKIIERHGGRIWVESTPGKGTTVYFTIGEKSS